MNQFRADPALGILYLVYNIREEGSPAMHRGTAVDETIGEMLAGKQSLDPDSLRTLATDKYDTFISETEEVYAEEAIRR